MNIIWVYYIYYRRFIRVFSIVPIYITLTPLHDQSDSETCDFPCWSNVGIKSQSVCHTFFFILSRRNKKVLLLFHRRAIILRNIEKVVFLKLSPIIHDLSLITFKTTITNEIFTRLIVWITRSQYKCNARYHHIL